MERYSFETIDIFSKSIFVGLILNGFDNSNSGIQLEGTKTFLQWDISRLGGIRTFWLKKIRREKLLKFIEILNYNKSSCIIFCVKMS